MARERTLPDLDAPRWFLWLLPTCGFVWLVTACTPDVGQVELNWRFVDRESRPLIPSDLRKDSCAIPARDAEGSTSADLIVQLTLTEADCPGDSEPDACQIIEPARFPCGRLRDTIVRVPSSEEPVLMTVDVLVVPARGNPFLAPSTCIAIPGPRRRYVNGGALTDLSVYQFVVHNMVTDDASRFDLEDCREPQH